jgi:myo-inositol-1(or 4)-monophosphatase
LTDWLALCRAAAEAVRGVLVDLPTREEREPVLRRGEGGDDTTAVDAAAEEAVLDRLRPLGVSIVSEELGRIEGSSTLVVVDPIDGSLNAKRGLPFFGLSVAVAAGGRMDDVHFAYVYDFGSGEEWTARSGEGAWLDGRPLGAVRPKERIEVLVLEATLASLVARHAAAFDGLAQRLRVPGSLALSLCHLAAGRVDGVCSLREARSVDIAAAQLLCREVGMAIELFDDPRPFAEAELDLERRSRVAAAGTPGLCREIAAALSA